MKTTLIPAVAVVLLAACQSMTEPPLRASAALQPTRGNNAAGEATFEQAGDRVRVVVTAQGLKPGQQHGFHIHEAGDCSAPDAMSAKGHFNPAGKLHGNPAAGEHHAGDLPALQAGADGRARAEALIEGVTIAPGPNSIVGRGLIVHADPDDYKTQPTGNSGSRIACGVIRAG